jgi:hypothetical protein
MIKVFCPILSAKREESGAKTKVAIEKGIKAKPV